MVAGSGRSCPGLVGTPERLRNGRRFAMHHCAASNTNKTAATATRHETSLRYPVVSCQDAALTSGAAEVTISYELADDDKVEKYRRMADDAQIVGRLLDPMVVDPTRPGWSPILPSW